jgi:CxxC-x17-CxxC domain-containing protein
LPAPPTVGRPPSFRRPCPIGCGKPPAKHLNDPVSVAVDPNPEDSAPIPHTAFDVADGNKLGALRDLLDHRGEGSIIVFGRTKHGVKKLARQLEQAGYPIAALQGNLSQNARDRVMADFRSGDVQILLATNVAARGLDVTSVEQVINFELPESPELLTHRVGRTGRMGRQGQAITLLGPEDGPKWRQLERGLGRRITRAPWRGAATVANGAEQARFGEPSEPRERPTRPTARREMAPTRPRQRPERADDRQREPRRPTPSSGRLFAQRPAPQSQTVWDEDVRDAVATESPRSLMVDYGRDPHRPAWAQADSGAASEGRPAPRARGGRAGARRTGEAHEVTCSGCGQPARVPFQPDPTRPVYCADCFRTRPTTARRDAAPRRNRESFNGA